MRTFLLDSLRVKIYQRYGAEGSPAILEKNFFLGHTKRQLWSMDFLGKKLEQGSDIIKILFLKEKFGMAKNLRASENVYVEILKISDFGLGFKASNVLAALLLPIKWTLLRRIMSLHAFFFLKKTVS